MKLWIMSDLHMDVLTDKAPLSLPKPRPDYDVLIIAGDIREDMVKGVKWITSNVLHNKPVIYVAGNHEFYGQAIDSNREDALEAASSYPNIHILQNEFVDIAGVRFIGATLWTDYALYGEAYRWQAYTAAQSSMNDHRRIRVASKGYSKFRTREAWQEHVVSRDFLDRALDLPFDGPRVVVTHHAPSIKSVAPEYAGDLLNAAYASRLEDVAVKANLWVHGHVHHRNDYLIDGCRVVSNPRGYVGYGEDTGFDPQFIIEIATNDRTLDANELGQAR